MGKKKTFSEMFEKYEKGPLTTIFTRIDQGAKSTFRMASQAQADAMRMRLYNAKKMIEEHEGEPGGPVPWLVRAAKKMMVLKRLDARGWRLDVIDRNGKDNPYNDAWLQAYEGDKEDLDASKIYDHALAAEKELTERARAVEAIAQGGAGGIKTLNKASPEGEAWSWDSWRKENEGEATPAPAPPAPAKPAGLPGFGKIDIAQYEKEREKDREENYLIQTVDKGEPD